MIEPKEQARALFGQDVDITVGLKVSSDGYVVLNWSNNAAVGRWDYVALYDKEADEPYGYLTGDWQYVSYQDSPFQTNYLTDKEGKAFWIGYGAWDYKTSEYEIVASAGPFVLKNPKLQA